MKWANRPAVFSVCILSVREWRTPLSSTRSFSCHNHSNHGPYGPQLFTTKMNDDDYFIENQDTFHVPSEVPSETMLSRSFESGYGFLDKYTASKKWACVSPMTQHVIREPPSPAKIRRRRSRSFNDYIDTLENNEKAPLLLPPLQYYKQTTDQETPNPTPPAIHDNGYPLETVSKKEEKNPAWVCFMYGMINATIVIPVVMSFGGVIYKNGAFAPYAPVLIKLTMVSGVIHQLCFSSLSSLPFAVGSVQDAGLIFLSSMATDMVDYCRSRGYDDEVMLATVTIGLSAATATLGFGLIVVGKLRLAGYVQMLPTSVVAGYLAFIGWFCGKSGVGLMAGTSDLLTLPILIENLVHILPGVFGGVFIYFSVRVLRHVAVLPTCILILLLMFYTGLSLTGSSIAQATVNGWIREAEPAPVWYLTWDYLKLNKVVWSALPQLLLTELSMVFVVALSSSLDVAAIELELKSPLNYNQELIMVGISNVVSGLTGGYTGSYIFSQSIFSLRSGIRSRLAGFVLAFCQVIVIVTPFPILAYVPNFFYGSLLLMICIDLMYEWLWDFRTKVTTAEYVIALATFGLMQFLGVEYGIFAGLVIYFGCWRLGIDVGELHLLAVEPTEEGCQDIPNCSPIRQVSSEMTNGTNYYTLQSR